MNRLVCILACVVVLALAGGCGDADAGRALGEADSAVCEAPDSALRILQTINPKRLSREQKAHYGLLVAKASDKCYIPLVNDSLIAYAADYYSGRGDSLEAQSLYYHGYYYSSRRSEDTALVVLNTAYEKALTAQDKFYAAMSAREMYGVYRRLLMINEGLTWAQNAKRLFRETGKPIHAAWMENPIADALIYKGEYSKAKELLDSLSQSNLMESRSFRYKVLINQIDLSLQLDSFDNVLRFYALLTDDDYNYSAHDRLNQAKASMLTGDYDGAESYISMARNMEMNESDSLYISKLLSELYASKGDIRRAYAELTSFSNALMRGEEKMLSNPKTKYLTDNYKINSALLRIKALRNRDLAIGALIGSILLIILLILVHKNYKSKLRNKALELEQLMASYQYMKEDLTLSNTRSDELTEENCSLKSTIAVKDKRFKEEIQSIFSRHLSLLNGMSRILNQQGRITDKSEINSLIKDNKLNAKLDSLVKEIGDEKVIASLIEVVDKYNDDWSKRFRKKYPDLKEDEYRLALYLHLGFRPFTISVISGRSVDAVYIATSKLRKKLKEFGINDEEVSLHNVMK